MLVVVLRVCADSPVAVRGGAGPLGPVLAIGRGSDQVVLDLPATPADRRAFLARLSEVVGGLLATRDDEAVPMTG
jgi:hypothetical protein